MNNSQLNRLLRDLASSPSLYPEEIDFDKRMVSFCRMDRDAYMRSAFLDGRKIRIDRNNYNVSLDYLLHTLGSPSSKQAAINWIFHTPHSGSTLIACALDELEGSFVLKEPIMMIQASSIKRHPEFQQWKRSREWHQFFTMVQNLLSRTFSETDVAVIKTTSVCHNLVQDIFCGTRPAKGLFLYSSLEKYLVSLYKGGYLDVYISNGWQSALHDIRQLNLMEVGEAEKLPRHLKVALLWLSIVLSMNAFMRDNPEIRMRVLDCEEFFAKREAVLLEVAAHFGFIPSRSSIKAIANGSIFNRDAKRANHKWDEAAVLERNKWIRRNFRREIEEALYWAEAVAKSSGLLRSVAIFSRAC